MMKPNISGPTMPPMLNPLVTTPKVRPIALGLGAAARFGFCFEGVFRQHMIVKGRNRDTAWFSITDGEWPPLKAAFERWLDLANFDREGRQRERLSALTKA